MTCKLYLNKDFFFSSGNKIDPTAKMIWTQGRRACTHDLGSSAPFLRAPVANCLVSRVWVQTLYPSLCLMSEPSCLDQNFLDSDMCPA